MGTQAKPEVIRDQWVCSECRIFIANGDLTGLDMNPETADEREAAILRGVEREAPYRWVPDSPRTGIECPDCDGTGKALDGEPCETCAGRGSTDEPEGADTMEFSCSECDCCGAAAGPRHRCALILVETLWRIKAQRGPDGYPYGRPYLPAEVPESELDAWAAAHGATREDLVREAIE